MMKKCNLISGVEFYGKCPHSSLRNKIFDTEIIRDYTIEKDSKIVTVKAVVDLHEKHKMLKFGIHVAVENPITSVMEWR